MASLFVFLLAACGPVFTQAANKTPVTAANTSPLQAPGNPPTPTVSREKLDALSKLNYLHTDGTKIVDSKGKEVRITGVNWFGAETGVLAPHGLWERNYKDMLDQIVSLGYNTIRLPFSNELLDTNQQPPEGIDFYKNEDLKGLNGLQIMDKIVTEAGKRNLKIILDQHRPTSLGQSKLWYSDALSEQQWINDWRFMAQRYYGNDTVIGADLHNEPAGDATWGTDDPKTDWRLAAEKAGNAILDVNPAWLIVVEGIEKSEDDFGNVLDWYWMGGSLQFAGTMPIRLNVPNRLVYSAHDYGPGVYLQGWFKDPDFPKNLPEVWDHHWGYIVKQGVAPLLLGEFGGESVGTDVEGIWQRALVQYLKDNGISYTYWAFNGNSADTGGLLKDKDWKTVIQDKQDLLTTYQFQLMENVSPETVDTSVQPDPRPAGQAVKGLHQDTTRLKWTKELQPEIYIANQTDKPMDISDLEVRYWFGPAGTEGKNTPKDQVVRVDSAKTIGKPIEPSSVKTEVLPYAGKETVDTIYYVKMTFAKGTIVPPRLQSGFRLNITQADGQAYYQEGHYSYRDYHWPAEWERIGIYRGDQQIWGMDPDQYAVQEKEKKLEKEAKVAAKNPS